MASVKVIIHKHKQKKDKTFPIAIRIIKNCKTSHISLGQSILAKDWNDNTGLAKSSHPNSGRLNNLILEKLKEAHAKVLETETNKEQEKLSAMEIKKMIKGRENTVTFFERAMKRIRNKFESGVFSVAKSQLSIMHNLNDFINHNPNAPKELVIDRIMERRKSRITQFRNKNYSRREEIQTLQQNNPLTFDAIDIAFIHRYKHFCKVYLGQQSRTISNQLIFIRTIYNLAIKEGITNGKNYPFGGDNEKIKLRSGNKIGLNREEIQRIEKLVLEPYSSIWHTQNVWLFAFYTAGMRISDVIQLKWSDFVDGRLYYQMNKNEKPVSLKLPEQANHILEMYAHRKINDIYVFPFLCKKDTQAEDIYRITKNATSLLNKYLKRIAQECNITKSLSNHIARHSFGNCAGDKINPYMLKQLYRHTNLSTTIQYQSNFMTKAADEALESVINL